MTADTLPKLLVRNAEQFGDRAALREKDLGIWQEVTWAQYRDHVRHFALGLRSLGFTPGDKLAIIGDNRPEWVYAALAAQSLSGISVGLYQDAVARELQYIVAHSDAKFIMVEDQEQVDKIFEIKSDLPNVKAIIYFDPKGLRKYDDPFLRDVQLVERRGQEIAAEQPGAFEEAVAATRAEDVAVLSYTSGTTGKPKGAMLSHQNLLSMATNMIAVDGYQPDWNYLSFLPLAWIGEQFMSFSCALSVGFTVNFPEEPDTVQENLREIGPEIIFAPPRIWENMLSTVQVKTEDAGGLKLALYRRFLPIGHEIADARFGKKPLTSKQKLLKKLAGFLVFAPIRDHLGLLKVRYAYTGGASLGPDMFRFFHAVGVNLKQVYGQTEIAGISALHRDDEIDFDTVGQPIPNTEMRISDTGEVLSRSPSVFLGYYKNPEATAQTLRDGWLHSGDAGLIDERGHLVIIDRMKDVMALADGSKFAPQYIENKLKFSQYIREAVVVGQGREYVAALINIDMANVGKWAEGNRVSYTTYTDLTQKKEINELVAADVRRVNDELPKAAKIRRFLLLHKELDADDDEMTRTRKVRRGLVSERYSTLIDALFSDVDEIPVDVDITYRDGRRARVKANVRVNTIEKPLIEVR